jgi:acetolactate synthase-1/2/3 large subunit
MRLPLGCRQAWGALREGLANTMRPTMIDVVVTRDPARMLAAADNRTRKVTKGCRPL